MNLTQLFFFAAALSEKPKPTAFNFLGSG